MDNLTKFVAAVSNAGGCMPTNATGTTAIRALISDAVKIPILAVGGIINKKFAKVVAILGAEGAFVSTRFILSKENPAVGNVKQDIVNEIAKGFI